MRLNLKNPLIVFDLETTGIDLINDRIVQISYVKVWPNGKEETRDYYVNPGRPIPAEATAVHHITDAMVADKPLFKEVASTIAKEFEGCDFAGFNSNRFDVPFLIEEFLRNGVDIDLSKRKFIDAQAIFHKMEPRTLTAALKFYCGESLEDAHSALADAQATYKVLMGQLDRYPELINDTDALAKISAYNRNVDFAGRIILNDQDVEVFNFGKYRGMSVEEVLRRDMGYYGWMMGGDFTFNTKNVLTKIKLRMMTAQ